MDLIISTTQFSLNAISSQDEFWNRVEICILKSKVKSADCILFPEYFSLSWLLFKCRISGYGNLSFLEQLQKANEFHDEFINNFFELTMKHNICIVAGTYPVIMTDSSKKIVNRCYVFNPEDLKQTNQKFSFYQDKLNMTRFEDEVWKIKGGSPDITHFMLKGFKIGIAICYDIEFPSYCAEFVKDKVEVILVPSCTEDIHGYWRVRYCAQARCIENQTYVVMSSIVGGHKDFPEINVHHGQGGIYTPCDIGYPPGGILEL